MTNIAVVVLDTLRKDAFDRHFDWLPGRRFENAWSPSHWTVPVHGAMFTGRYPSEVGTTAKSERLDYEGPVLAEQLGAAGHTTRAFSSNPYVSPVFDYDRGFDEFTGSWRLRHLDPELFDWNRFIAETSDDGVTRYIRALARCIRDDCKTLPSLKQGLHLKLREFGFVSGVNDDGAAEALDYVEQTEFGSDEFLYLNLMEAHTPYDPPEEYETVDLTHGLGLTETLLDDHDATIDVEAVEQAYDDCVRYLSDIYEKIFSALTDEFDYVITLADHGELLGEHDGWGHGYGLYRELTNVPLSVYGPDIDGGTTDELVSLLDIHATVADIAGIETADDTRGRSLLTAEPTDACLTEFHGLTHRRIDALHEDGISDELLQKYDKTLRGIALNVYYGFETPDGFVESGGTDDDGQTRLEALVSTLDIAEPETGDEELSEDVIDQLEDLGYA
jgi:arylsulfatase A-like enzyme